jgi:phosphohistidine swiveling domain-containing protein
MNLKTTFSKAYTRDFSIIMEEAWYDALSRGLWVRLDAEAPKELPNFYRFNKGIIEVWENNGFIQQIMDAIQKKRSDAKFFRQLLEDYAVLVDELKSDRLPDEPYLKKLFEAISLFSIIWYGIHDEMIEKALRQKLVDVRDRDTIFDSNDKIIRKRILKKFPPFNGFETTLLKDEFLGKPPAASVLKERLDGFILVPEKYAGMASLEEFASSYRINVEVFERPKDYVIKGVAAQPGRAVGKARIIRMKSDLGKMRDGEVLVSPMTTPDVFPVMRKACAIVTDEGGMLCHAAIISRELGIPCVIGTKVASEVFKDGDLVEVDADHGVVRKVKA